MSKFKVSGVEDMRPNCVAFNACSTCSTWTLATDLAKSPTEHQVSLESELQMAYYHLKMEHKETSTH